MAVSDGIGSLPQTRELFTAPGSLLGHDPYFQDVQRFQQGGLGTGVSYESLQTDPDRYGATMTAEERARSTYFTNPITGNLTKIDIPGLAAKGILAATPYGGVVGAVKGAYGVYQDLTAAEKMRAGMLPPETYQPLGVLDKIATAWPEFLGGRSYEEALTDKDVETLSQYGLAGGVGGDLVGPRGGYNLYTPPGTDFGRGLESTRKPGPRYNTVESRLEYAAQLDRARQFDMQGWMSNLANQIAANKVKEFETQRIDPLRGSRVYTEDLPRVGPRPEVTVEELAPVPTLDEIGAWTGGLDWATGDNGASDDDTSGFGAGGDEGLGY